MDIIIRPGEAEDLDYLVKAGKKLFEIERKFEPLLKYSEAEARDSYSAELDNPNALLLLAMDGNKKVGYAYAHMQGVPYLDNTLNECMLEVVYVEEAYRKAGVGGKLTQEVVDWAKKNKVFRVKAGVFCGNQSSLNLFKKMKFTKYHETWCFDLD